MKPCPACEGSDCIAIHSLEQAPSNQNIVYRRQEEALSAPCGDIVLTCCETCGFVYNGAFDAQRVSYGPEYHNDQSASEHFFAYISRQIDWLSTAFINRSDTLGEIGCGNGYYIRALAERFDGMKYGFDTAYEGEEWNETLKLRYYKQYFDSCFQHLGIDFYLCRHVIEHIEYPLQFLKSIRAVMKEGALFFLETPDFDWIVEHEVIFDINYEHCSYYTLSSFARLLRRAGFEVVVSLREFGGQYLWFVVRASRVAGDDCHDVSLDRYRAFGEGLAAVKCRYRATIDALTAQGKKIAVWGAGGKGNMFLNLIDKNRVMIDCAVDINPGKHGRYIGGTGHPIIAPNEIGLRGIDSIIVMNPNYREEIDRTLQGLGVRPELLTLE